MNEAAILGIGTGDYYSVSNLSFLRTKKNSDDDNSPVILYMAEVMTKRSCSK